MPGVLDVVAARPGPHSHRLTQLVDVHAPAALADNDTMVYDGTTGFWVPTQFKLSNLADMQFSSLADDDLLVYNSAGAVWQNATVAAAVPLSGVGGVSITAAAAGDVLRHNGVSWVNDSAAWATQTPTLTGSISNPALGTGGNVTQTGRYYQLGGVVFYRVVLRWGNTSTGFGSGIYQVSLPVNAQYTAGQTHVLGGSVELFDSSAVDMYPAVPELIDATKVGFRVTDGVGAAMTSDTAPFTWANDDMIAFSIAYEAA